MKSVHVLIEGKVQGVWFRDSMRQEAQRLGVKGWVRNVPDGRVEAHVEGDAGAVDDLLAWCNHGPTAARVAAVATDEAAPEGHEQFQVVH